jgi:hypothetical protein
MGEFNAALVNAGVLVAGEGLKPSSFGARVRFSGSGHVVTDGPFTESKELIGGFWIWKVASVQEAIDWVKRCPKPTGEQAEIEIRPLYEPEDFALSDPTGEIRTAEARMRAEVEATHAASTA